LLGAIGAGMGGCGPLDVLSSLVSVEKGGVLFADNLAYGADPAQTMDVFRPERPGTAPILIHVHGGRWDSGRAKESSFVGRAFAARGFVTVLPNYRKLPTHRYPVFLEDIAEVIHSVRKRAADWGGNPQQIFLSGHSAGAHTVAMLALEERWLSQVGLSRSVLGGVATLAGAFDVFPFRNATVRAAFGQMPDPARAVPRIVAERGGPPLYIMHGTSDAIVPVSDAMRLFESLRALGIEATFVPYPSVGHMGILLALTRTFRNELAVMHNMIAFFERNGATPLYPSSGDEKKPAPSVNVAAGEPQPGG